MQPLIRLHSRYARMTPETVEGAIEHVRAAEEVLFGCELFDARDMIRVARTVLETELLYERDPARFVELTAEPRSDWTLACMAECFAQANVQLHERGSGASAERLRVDQRSVLRRIVDSPLRSPLIGYDAVLSALMYELRPANRTELIELQRLALSEALILDSATNVHSLLCELAEGHLQLGQVELALTMFLTIAVYDPTNIWVHNHIAIALSRRFPGLAHAAATRALLLMPREDRHALRPQLRAIIEETSRAQAELPEGAARILHRELQGQPGKRSRASLRTLSLEVAPEIQWLPVKQPEPLPDSVELAQLRRDLQSLPRPVRVVAEPARTVPLQPTAAKIDGKVGRNDPCPCGSEKKWKRCCGAR